MTDIQAAIARVQLKSLDRFIQIRKEISGRYDEALSGSDTVLLTSVTATSLFGM
jgi:dTDP-4-amino-4,6-dideoxygalactose transaminase